MAEWVRRPYNPETDESTLVYTWITSYAHSRYGRRCGADVVSSKAYRNFWDAHRPLVVGLLGSATVEVVCDPERVDQSDAGPPVIWGWACTDKDVIHYAFVKRSVVKAELGLDMMKDLLGDRFARPCSYTFEQVELRRVMRDTPFKIPYQWYPDFTFFGRQAA